MKYSLIAFTAPFILTANIAAQDVGHCLGLVDTSARLACFDDAHSTPASIRFPDTQTPKNIKPEIISPKNIEPVNVTPPQAPQSLPAKPVTVTPSTTPTLTAEDRFGKSAAEIEASTAQKELKTISSNIKSSQLTRANKVRVTLENGQVWQQASFDNTRIIGSRLKRQTSVVIKRGLFGSYTMTTEPWGRSMKVKRVK